jgi:hypothetical protein
LEKVIKSERTKVSIKFLVTSTFLVTSFKHDLNNECPGGPTDPGVFKNELIKSSS